jgi:hypothetical protein
MFIASEPQTPFAAAAAEGERVVDRLHPDQRVEQHPVVRVERDVVILTYGFASFSGSYR